MSLCNKVSLTALYFGLLMLAFNETNGVLEVNDYEATCQMSFVKITQSPNGKLGDGTPLFAVTIENDSVTGNAVAQVHVNCTHFTPWILRRAELWVIRVAGDNDCLVNMGDPIRMHERLSFDYPYSQMLPLQVSSFVCLDN